MTLSPDVRNAMIDSFSRVVGEQVDELTYHVRAIMVEAMGKIEQGMQQRKPMSPVHVRKLEWQAAKDIVALVRGQAEDDTRLFAELLNATRKYQEAMFILFPDMDRSKIKWLEDLIDRAEGIAKGK